MTAVLREFAVQVRKIAREEALRTVPPPTRYRVARRKPLTLEAFGSDDRLVDGDDGFDATALRSRAKVDDTAVVITDWHGDKIALGVLRTAAEEEDEGGDETPVESVFGRTGAVTAKAGDYDVSEVTGAAAQADLEAEEAARAEGDADEAAAREAGITGEQEAREAAIAAEQEAREAADAAEQGLREAADALLATKAEVNALLAAADALVFKGTIDCSGNPNYPAADAGHTYRVSVAGKIGGAAGANVEVGDLLICIKDGSAAGTQAAVGANWNITQTNIDGAVTGPAAATSGDFATYNGASGKLIQDPGWSRDIDATLAANSDSRIPSQKAVKGYVTTQAGLLVPKALLTTKGDLIAATAASTPARVGAGANGQVLTADSAQAAGVKWATPASGEPSGITYTFWEWGLYEEPGNMGFGFSNKPETAEFLLFNKEDALGHALAPWLEALDDSTNAPIRGQIIVQSIADPSKLHVFNITGEVNDLGTAIYIAVEWVSGSGEFAEGEELAVRFARAGDAGTNGANGAPGEDGNSILSGKGAPAEELGNDGDLYIDLENMQLYGPKGGSTSPLEQIATAAVTDTLKGSPSEAEWPKLGWSSSRGTFNTTGWHPPGYSTWAPTHSFGGTYLNSKLSGGDAYVYTTIPATYGLINGAEYRSFSAWLFSGGGSAKANGYQLRLKQASSGTGAPHKYIFVLYKFVEGAETLLAESAEVTIETGGAFGLARLAGKLTMYRRETEGGEWVQVGEEVADAAFTEGYSGIDGTGSNPTLDDFSTGELSTGGWGTGVSMGGASSVPTGSVFGTSLATAPAGYIIANGENRSRVAYPELHAKYAAEGYPYGSGDGVTTFGVPDYRGRVLVGLGTHADVNALTDGDGLAVGSRTPKHTHTGPSHTHEIFFNSGVDNDNDVHQEGGGGFYEVAAPNHIHLVSGGTRAGGTGATGSGGPAYGVINYIIKT